MNELSLVIAVDPQPKSLWVYCDLCIFSQVFIIILTSGVR